MYYNYPSWSLSNLEKPAFFLINFSVCLHEYLCKRLCPSIVHACKEVALLLCGACALFIACPHIHVVHVVISLCVDCSMLSQLMPIPLARKNTFV